MNNIDTNTVKLLLREYYEVNKKMIWIALGNIAGFCFAITTFEGFFGVVMNESNGEIQKAFSQLKWDLSIPELCASGSVSYCGLVVMLGLLLATSNVFRNMSTKSGDITFLTLPASNLEKWISRIVYVFLLCVACYAAFYVGMLLAGALAFTYNSEFASVIFGPSSVLFEKMHLHINYWLYAFMSNLTVIGICFGLIYGGTYYRRNAFGYNLLWLVGIYVFTVISIAVYAIICIIPVVNQNASNAHQASRDSHLTEFLGTWIPELFSMVNYVSVIIFIIGAILLRLSYKKFCHRQLEMRKIKRISK